MTLNRRKAQDFWNEDLSVIEARLLKTTSVTDLPVMKEEWRVPNQGTVLAFNTVNIDNYVIKWDLSVIARALKQYITNLKN